ncbi:MAG: LytTR family DNA-binding domain-containing protein [Clostridiales bacterium]|jgi:DNA-binding LytR/AlgR family response regulator|nr:LytTR family DNA-binding domain-containing protein [Clostridiales bacterium]
MKIAICDDERDFTGNLKSMINKYLNHHRIESVIDEYSSGESILQNTHTYDMVFLDYRMDGLNGLETARIMRKNNAVCSIVFVTNYPDFVYDAFEVDTFRFLKKPVNEYMVNYTMDGYFAKFGNDFHILLQVERETVTVNTKDIVYLEAMGKHCIVHTVTESLNCATTMSVISRMLPNQHFYKTHKAFIINMNYIDRYKHDEVLLKNGKSAFISRNYYRDFKQTYCDYSLQCVR